VTKFVILHPLLIITPSLDDTAFKCYTQLTRRNITKCIHKMAPTWVWSGSRDPICKFTPRNYLSHCYSIARDRLQDTRSSAITQKQGVSNAFFVAKLLSIAVMTYSYMHGYHLRNLHLMFRQICYAHSELTSACDRSTCAGCATPLSFDVSFLQNPCKYGTRISFILPETIESLNYMTAATVWVYLYLFLCNCLQKPRKDVQEER